jgi:predicted amidohydrolase
MGQTLVEGGAVEANLRRACAMIARAAAEDCEIVVLPECLDMGWTWPDTLRLATPIPGPVSGQLAAAARAGSIYVVAGLTERAGERVYNAAVILSPQGELLGVHRKINELDIAHHLYEAGDSVRVIHTPLAPIGTLICADNFPNSLVFGHALARMGARLILSPCAWAVDADHDNSRTPYGDLWAEAYSRLACLYDICVIGVSNVGWLSGGPWKGRKCIGCSMAMGPDGKLLALGPYGVDAEALVVVDAPVTPAPCRGTDWAPHLERSGHAQRG